MKKAVLLISICFIVIGFTADIFGQYKISTETSLKNDAAFSGVEVHRTAITIPHVSMKYDLYPNVNGKKVNDVFSAFYTDAIKTKNFTFEAGFIKLGDMEKEDEYFVDLFAKVKFDKFSVSGEIGQGVGPKQLPRSFFISRFSHDLFTVEAGLVSKKGYSNLEEFAQDKYYWLGFHPENYFVALGNNINTTWMIGSTRDLKNFGNLTFLSVDRSTGDFWMRSQTGVESVNQNFFSLDNLIGATSYLIVTPFHFQHFSPSSTKGLYSLKVDAKKVGNVEKKEILFGRQFGQYGQISLGGQNQLSNGNGIVVEYFNSIPISKLTGSIELRYESLAQRLTGFITLKYNL